MVQSQLSELSENLRSIVKRELYTIENDTKIWSKRLSSALWPCEGPTMMIKFLARGTGGLFHARGISRAGPVMLDTAYAGAMSGSEPE